MARGKEASMLRWFRKLDDKYNFLELQRFSIDADLQKLYDFLTRVNAKIGRSTPMQVGLFLLAVLLGIAVPGGWGVALGACPGVTGLAITVGTDDLQNLRVATRVRIEQWEQKLRQVNDELQKVKPYREAAMQHVKQTRGELDALESTWKTHYGDLWYQRTRPELPGERPFWDF